MGWDISNAEIACVALLAALVVGLYVNAGLKIRAYRRGRKMLAICPACRHQFTCARFRLAPNGDNEKVNRERIGAAIALRLGMTPVSFLPVPTETTATLHTYIRASSFKAFAKVIADELENVWT